MLGVAVLRRAVARLLAVVLFVLAPGLIVLPSSVAADPSVERVVSFADVPESSLFRKEISWLAAEGISTGWDVGGGVRQYRPLDSIARDAMAAFLYRKAGSPVYTPPAASPFTDVAPGAAFYKEITWLASKGISTGWDVGGGKREYRPLSPIARDAMAAFLFRFAQPGEFAAPVQSPFVDVPAGGGFYKEITWLASSGISTGWDLGGGVREYRPLDGIARDAMAAFLYRYAAPKIPADPLDPAAGTVTVAPDVEILDAGQLDTAVVSAGMVTLSSDRAQDIRANDVLVAGVTAGTPEGLLARVVEVARDPGGNTVVTTKPATLVEAVVSTSGLLEVTGTPVFSEFVPEQDVTETTGGSAARSEFAAPMAQASADVFNRSFSLQKTVRGEFGKPDAPLSGDGSVTVKSTVTAKAKAKMTLEAGFLQLKEASVTVTPSLTAGHSLTATGSLKGEVSAKLGELNSAFTFMVGPVPVVVTSQSKVNANFTLDGDADVAFTSSQTVSSDHGFKYREGSFNLINTKPATTGIQKDIKASATLTARASLDADATIKLYGMAGITFGVGPYATTTITVTFANGDTSWSCPLELGVQGRLGVTAGIEVMGFKLGDWTKNTTNNWTLFTDNPCQGTPVVVPTPVPAPTPAPSPTPTPDPEHGNAHRVLTGHGPGMGYEVRTDGTVMSWGGKTYEGSLPEPVPGLTGVRSMAAGYGTAYATKSDGSVWGWGDNSLSQLGDGSGVSRSTPAVIRGLSDVIDVAPMYYGALALKKDGTVWAWGMYTMGEDAMHAEVRPTPQRLPSLSGITAIAAGPFSGFALKNDGTVWAWGDNGSGEIGDGTTSERLDPVKVSGLSNVKAISAGNGTAYALTSDGRAWGWGSNSWGELGDGTTLQRLFPVAISGLAGVVSIEGGDGNAYALMNDGTVRGWGYNSYGAVGSGDTGDRHVPTPVRGVTGAVSVSAGAGCAYVVLDSGDALAWGWNAFGQLGDGTTQNRASPVLVGVQGTTS